MTLLRLKKFGKYKVIIVSAIVDGQEFNYHHNILLTNTTTFEQYYSKVKDIIATHFDKGYQVDVVNSFKIIVWIRLRIKKLKSLAVQLKIINLAFNIQKLKLTISPLPLLSEGEDFTR